MNPNRRPDIRAGTRAGTPVALSPRTSSRLLFGSIEANAPVPDSPSVAYAARLSAGAASASVRAATSVVRTGASGAEKPALVAGTPSKDEIFASTAQREPDGWTAVTRRTSRTHRERNNSSLSNYTINSALRKNMTPKRSQSIIRRFRASPRLRKSKTRTILCHLLPRLRMDTVLPATRGRVPIQVTLRNGETHAAKVREMQDLSKSSMTPKLRGVTPGRLAAGGFLDKALRGGNKTGQGPPPSDSSDSSSSSSSDSSSPSSDKSRGSRRRPSSPRMSAKRKRGKDRKRKML
ncbi:hypothetical protein B0H14DRAFT_2762572, partial [Mycena olivaceomarginata]